MKKLIYVLATAKLVLPFLLQNAVYEHHRDEFLYLDVKGHKVAQKGTTMLIR